MPLRNESARAQAWLQLETPISDDASLHKLQEQVADYVREAKHCDPSEPNELISIVLDEVARDYFRHAIRKQRPPRHLGDEHLDANGKAGSGNRKVPAYFEPRRCFVGRGSDSQCGRCPATTRAIFM